MLVLSRAKVEIIFHILCPGSLGSTNDLRDLLLHYDNTHGLLVASASSKVQVWSIGEKGKHITHLLMASEQQLTC